DPSEGRSRDAPRPRDVTIPQHPVCRCSTVRQRPQGSLAADLCDRNLSLPSLASNIVQTPSCAAVRITALTLEDVSCCDLGRGPMPYLLVLPLLWSQSALPRTNRRVLTLASSSNHN